MPAHLTEQEARALLGDEHVRATPRKRTTKRTARGPYHSACHDCDKEFKTEAGEKRHSEATGHHRFQLVLDLPA